MTPEATPSIIGFFQSTYDAMNELVTNHTKSCIVFNGYCWVGGPYDTVSEYGDVTATIEPTVNKVGAEFVTGANGVVLYSNPHQFATDFEKPVVTFGKSATALIKTEIKILFDEHARSIGCQPPEYIG
jgi:hypothetical protein